MSSLPDGACAPWALGGTALILCAAGVAAQEPTLYGGNGFKEPLVLEETVTGVAFGDFDGDGSRDLVRWDGDGSVTFHDRFADQDERTVIGTGLESFGVTRQGGDRIWGTTGNLLRELHPEQADLGKDEEVPPAPPAVALLAPSVFRTQERPGGSRLLVIDNGGGRARAFALDQASPFRTHVADPVTEGELLDVALADWNHDQSDDLLVVSEAGLRVYNAANVQIGFIPSIADRAFVDVLPGVDTQYGHDLVFFHSRASLQAPAQLTIANASHSEQLYVDPIDLKRVCFANFTGAPRRELILPFGGLRAAAIISQWPAAHEGDPVFGINYGEVNLVDLAAGEESAIPTEAEAPLTAVADLDADGDEDVLLADDRGYGLVVLSQASQSDLRVKFKTAMALEPQLQGSGSASSLLWNVDLSSPAGADEIEIELWAQPDLESPAQFLCGTTKASTYTGPLVLPLGAAPGSTIYHILFRADDFEGPSLPVRVRLWSFDSNVMTEVLSLTSSVYPWAWPAAGGTVERPKIHPGSLH